MRTYFFILIYFVSFQAGFGQTEGKSEKTLHPKIIFLTTSDNYTTFQRGGAEDIVVRSNNVSYKIDSLGNFMESPIYAEWNKGFEIFKDSITDKKGVISKSGKIIVPSQFKEVFAMYPGFFKVWGEPGGLVDTLGNFIFNSSNITIDTPFIRANFSSDSVRYYNLISKKYLPENKRLHIGFNSGSYIAYTVDDESKFQLFNSQNELISDSIFLKIEKIDDRYFKVKEKNGILFLYEKRGEELKQRMKVEKVKKQKKTDFFVIQKSSLYGLYDSDLNEVIPPKYSKIECSSIGCALMDSLNNSFIYNHKKIISVGKFDNFKAGDFFFIGCNNSKKTYHNRRGKIVIDDNKFKTRFPKIKVINEKLFFGLNGRGYNATKMAVIDKKGRSKYSEYFTFESFNSDTDLFIIKQNEKFGLLSKKGKVVLAPIYDRITSHFRNSHFYVFKSEGLKGLFHYKGGLLFEPSADFFEVNSKDYIILQRGSSYSLFRYIP